MKRERASRIDDHLGISGLSYQPDFISAEEEAILLKNINSSPWNTSIKRRTQHYGYIYNYTNKGANVKTDPIPDWCNFLIDRLVSEYVLPDAPDQLIINEYLPGQGIASHTDSVATFKDGIVSISLGSDIIMDFSKKEETKECHLPGRSMIALNGPARYEWRHGIAARVLDHGVKRGTRVSLTFRKMK